MDGRKDFTIDNATFADLPGFVDELHAAGMHYIPIIDPGISSTETPGTYPPYDEGSQQEVFIKNTTGQELVGVVSSISYSSRQS